MNINVNTFAQKLKSYVSKQIPLFVHHFFVCVPKNYGVRSCNFHCASMQMNGKKTKKKQFLTNSEIKWLNLRPMSF